MPEPYDVITMGRIGVDIYPLQTGVPLARGRDLREVPRRLADQRRGGRRPAGRRTAVITRTGRGPVRRLPPPGAGGVRRGRPLGERRGGVSDPGHLLRDLPAGRLPALLLPAAQGARPGDPRRRAGPGRRAGRPDLLDDRHRTVRRAQPHRHPRRARARSAAAPPHEPGPRAPPSSTSTGGRCSGTAGTASSAAPGPATREALAHATVAVGNLDECEIATG